MRARHFLDLRRRHVLAAHAYAVAQSTVEIEVAVRVPRSDIAGTKSAVSEALRGRAWILVVPAGERARQTLANHDLSRFTNPHGTAGGAHDGHVKPRHRPADRAERPAEINRGDARAFRHAAAFGGL